ncbi:uncharacterized protein K489DRAFT_385578 [Dissoconium aciculare CBS 342.82]|uniref:Uncharacterized protein n=1 Tax=Dissoconium aciculare CBS 342.82 TaxID=1314786 RepID=A0A6J3LP49_9PEZI|nr:uncharacterized protein K489DRAFT_385578 [Dissoconium aciculare CBS 342.82]KAF1817741.1 hypothetical protein K489DRAFT_385578 [Dissoconium aciculare CBS 342.82]
MLNCGKRESLPGRDVHQRPTRNLSGERASNTRAEDCAAAECQLLHEFSLAVIAGENSKGNGSAQPLIDHQHEDLLSGKQMTRSSNQVRANKHAFDGSNLLLDAPLADDDTSSYYSADDGYCMQLEEVSNRHEQLGEQLPDCERSEQLAEDSADVTSIHGVKFAARKRCVPVNNVNMRVERGTNQKTSRFGRTLIHPLKFWLNEGYLWKHGIIQGIIRAELVRQE